MATQVASLQAWGLVDIGLPKPICYYDTQACERSCWFAVCCPGNGEKGGRFLRAFRNGFLIELLSRSEHVHWAGWWSLECYCFFNGSSFVFYLVCKLRVGFYCFMKNQNKTCYSFVEERLLSLWCLCSDSRLCVIHSKIISTVPFKAYSVGISLFVVAVCSVHTVSDMIWAQGPFSLLGTHPQLL